MSNAVDKLVQEAGEALLDAVWQEANTFGEHTEQVIKIIDGAVMQGQGSASSMQRIMDLTGMSTVEVVMTSVTYASNGLIRQRAAAEYTKARRLQEELIAEEQAAHPGADWDKAMNSWAGQEDVAGHGLDTYEPADGEPAFEEQVKAERLRQIEKGYDAAHDDQHGLSHLERIRNGYPHDSVKYAAMNQAVNDWYDRNGEPDEVDELLLDD